MGTDPPFSTRIDSRNGVTNIALTGELDIASVPVLESLLTAADQDGARAIVVDLRDLSFVDSSGLHALVRAYRRSEQGGRPLLLVGATPSTRRLCEMTRTEFILDARGTAELLGRFTGDGSPAREQDLEAGAEPHV
jgi:anti-anti-sigma factor